MTSSNKYFFICIIRDWTQNPIIKKSTYITCYWYSYFVLWIIIRLKIEDVSESFIYKIVKNNLNHTIVIGQSLTVTASYCNSKKFVPVFEGENT
jgi:hypothetical protein